MLDTGAMYRAVAVAALERGPRSTTRTPARGSRASTRSRSTAGVTTIDGRDVSAEIRAPEATAAVSTVAAHPGVRTVLVARQRAWVQRHGGGVVEGRDIGTVVFPAAPLKVYLTASDDERARRRQRDETASARAVDVDEVRRAIAQSGLKTARYPKSVHRRCRS